MIYTVLQWDRLRNERFCCKTFTKQYDTIPFQPHNIISTLIKVKVGDKQSLYYRGSTNYVIYFLEKIIFRKLAHFHFLKLDGCLKSFSSKLLLR